MINQETAKKKPMKSDPLMIPFFAGMLSPYVDNRIRGALVGLSLSHKASDIFYSIFESTSFALKLNFEYIKKFIQNINYIIVSGGGSKSDKWCQMKADITGLYVKRVKEKNSSLVGAAVLGAIATGLYPDFESCSEKLIKIEREFYPSIHLDDYYNDRFEQFKELITILNQEKTNT